MPLDPTGLDDDDELEARDADGPSRRFTDFDCPLCSANNPIDDPFGKGDRLICFYCGQELEAFVTESGRLRMQEI